MVATCLWSGSDNTEEYLQWRYSMFIVFIVSIPSCFNSEDKFPPIYFIFTTGFPLQAYVCLFQVMFLTKLQIADEVGASFINYI